MKQIVQQIKKHIVPLVIMGGIMGGVTLITYATAGDPDDDATACKIAAETEFRACVKAADGDGYKLATCSKERSDAIAECKQKE